MSQILSAVSGMEEPVPVKTMEYRQAFFLLKACFERQCYLSSRAKALREGKPKGSYCDQVSSVLNFCKGDFEDTATFIKKLLPKMADDEATYITRQVDSLRNLIANSNLSEPELPATPLAVYTMNSFLRGTPTRLNSRRRKARKSRKSRSRRS